MTTFPQNPARVTPTVGGEALAKLREELATIKLAACDTRYSSAAVGMRVRNLWSIYEAGIEALQSPTIASEKEPVQATGGASERVCDHPVTEKGEGES